MFCTVENEPCALQSLIHRENGQVPHNDPFEVPLVNFSCQTLLALPIMYVAVSDFRKISAKRTTFSHIIIRMHAPEINTRRLTLFLGSRPIARHGQPSPNSNSYNPLHSELMWITEETFVDVVMAVSSSFYVGLCTQCPIIHRIS